jgi:hypothetical protein
MKKETLLGWCDLAEQLEDVVEVAKKMLEYPIFYVPALRNALAKLDKTDISVAS